MDVTICRFQLVARGYSARPLIQVILSISRYSNDNEVFHVAISFVLT